MAAVPVPSRRPPGNGYPTGSRYPSPKGDAHRNVRAHLLDALRRHYRGQDVYVSGDLLVFYQEGDRRRRLVPDVWLARGVVNEARPNYLIWQETRGPELVVQLCCERSYRRDQTRTLELCRDVLGVREYFLFDPTGDYLDPQLLGYRLRGNVYQQIRPRQGRLPSQVTGLHLERDGNRLRLWNPQTQAWLPTPCELFDDTQDQLKQTQQENQQLLQQNALLQQHLAELRGK